MDFKTTTVFAYLNFTVENPTCMSKNYFQEIYLQGWKCHPVSVVVLYQLPVPIEDAVLSISSAVVLELASSCVPLPGLLACLAFFLLEIHSRNRKHETHLNS